MSSTDGACHNLMRVIIVLDDALAPKEASSNSLCELLSYFWIVFQEYFSGGARFSSGPRVNPAYVKEFINYTFNYEGVISHTDFCPKSTANPRCHG